MTEENPQAAIAALLRYQMGDHVLKVGEDSTFEGYVVSAFLKRNGHTVRYVVENDDGVLHIASEKQLKFISPQAG
jgi:hypothetical protein